jgi:anti-sigma B factor antagonist
MPEDFLPTPFSCETTRVDGVARVRPVGELDMSTAPVLEGQLSQAIAAGSRQLVVDLSGLEFMDSTGLTLLTRWSLGAERDGYDLALVPGGDRIQRLFELTRLSAHFRFVPG